MSSPPSQACYLWPTNQTLHACFMTSTDIKTIELIVNSEQTNECLYQFAG